MTRLVATLVALSLLACGASADTSGPPDDPHSSALARHHLDAERWRQELAEVDARLAEPPTDATVEYEISVYRALVLLRLRDVESAEALERYDLCLDLAPDGLAGGSCELSRVGDSRAREAFEQVLTTWPEGSRTDEGLYWLATLMFEEGHDAALPLFHRIVTDFPESSYRSSACLMLGEHYFALNMLAPAEAAYECARTDEDPAVRTFASYKLAWVLLDLGDEEGALDMFLEAHATTLPGEPIRRQIALDVVLAYTHLDSKGDRAVAGIAALADDAPGRIALLEHAVSLYADWGLADACHFTSDALIEAYPDHPARPEWEARSADPLCLDGNRAP